jgi:hypothetical protein
MSALDGVFYITIGTLFCGGVALCIKTIYKVKCNKVECCGCIKIERDIEDELKSDLEPQENAERNRRSSLSLGFNKISS